MKIFSTLYAKVMAWSRHPYAEWFLGTLSFAESSFFPIPPDVMLAPMSLAKPDRAWRYAFLTTVTSVLGGMFGYCLGYFFIQLLHPWITQMGYETAYQQVVAWFSHWGLYVVFIAGFTPVPYKLFTIAAGALVMPILPFIFISLISRGARFFLVAGLMRWGGEKLEKALMKYIDMIAMMMVFAAMIIYFAINLSGCMEGNTLKPAVVNAWEQKATRHVGYTVKKGDTLYSIAWRYGMDYRNLAKLNGIRSPYHLAKGQTLKMRSGRIKKPAAKSPLNKTKRIPRKIITPKVHHANYRPKKWRWPAQGRLIKGFSVHNKGINITGRMGQPIMTTAGGVVVYAGSGLHAYGKLLIVKHNDEYLSAYAHNSKLLVKEGQHVKPGQVIARMGRAVGQKPMLHFEIRQAGEPVNPLAYLSSKHKR